MRQGRSLPLATRLLLAFVVVPLMIVGFSSAPPPQTSGAPGEGSCWAAGCHQTSSGELLEDSESLSIHFPEGNIYSPGVPQILSLEINDPAGAVFGYQLSSRDDGNLQAGNLAALDAGSSVNTAGGIQYLGNNITPNITGMFEFEWVPPQSDVGPVTMFAAAVADAGTSGRSGDRVHLQDFVINPAAAPGAPSINGDPVQSTTFSGAQNFSPNTFATIAGDNLTQVTLTWDRFFTEDDEGNLVAPQALGGLRVLYNGEPAHISFVGDSADIGQPFDQVNFVVPESNAKGPATVEVETSGGRSAAVMVNNETRSPTLFFIGPFGRTPQAIAAVHLDGTLVGPSDLIPGATLHPAKAGDNVLVFGTGFGETTPPVPVGTLPGSVISRTTEDVRICFGDVEVTPSFAGLSGFVGLYQFVVQVPDVPGGDVPFAVKIAGVETQGGMSIFIE